MTRPGRHGRPRDVRVALICALPREYDAALLILDEEWEADESADRRAGGGQAQNHTVGRVGNHVVVLVLLVNTGKVGAATETARLKSVYPGLELALLTGVCGGVPRPGTADEMLLGDVVISKSIVQYDMGRQYPGRFDRKDTVEDNLGRPGRDVRALLVVLETQAALSELQERVRQNLARVQREAADAGYRTSYSRPATAEDVLFEPAYSHRHRVNQSECGCSDSVACGRATGASCEELRCEAKHRVPRRRLATPPGEGQGGEDAERANAPEPRVHIGRVGSGDTVMKSGEHRDSVAEAHGLVAFEMEGAGVWDEMPCIVVKGVCDYADSHKNKKWQDFAAAMAAAAARALLERYPAREKPDDADASSMTQVTLAARPKTIQKPCDLSHHVIPLAKNKRFVERSETSQLKRMLFDEANPAVALVGLGGVGKTQVALDLAYWVKENKPGHSVFWVPAVSLASFELAYTDMATQLGVSAESEGEDIKSSVHRFLSSKKAGPWFLVVDNADDDEILHGSSSSSSSDGREGLYGHLPQSEDGATLFTTRLRDLALSVADDAVVDLDAMDEDDARSLFGRWLHPQRQSLLRDSSATTELLGFLACLPLAVTQAAAYLNRNRHVSVARYLELLRGTEQTRTSTLSREFGDRTRYPESRNAVATTWLVSFDRIRQTDGHAAELLCFVSRVEPRSIPRAILRCCSSGSEDDLEHAIGTLCSYAFLAYREDAESFDMHGLVHLAARFWARQRSIEEDITASAARHLDAVFPTGAYGNRAVWRRYMPHALKLWGDRAKIGDVAVQSRLYTKVGWFLLVDKRDHEAIKLLEQLVDVTAALDEGHPDRLASQHFLAVAYNHNSQPKEAISLLEHVVRAREGLGEGHPDRLESQYHLAIAYRQDGQHQKAIGLLEHVVKAREGLDENDAHRLASQHELAHTYLEVRQHKEAVNLLEHVSRARERFVEDHPDRLASQHELARACYSDGRYKDAIKLLEHVLKVESTRPDEMHQSQLDSQHLLAKSYNSDGRYREAIELSEDVIKALGEGHPGRLLMEHVLAQACHNAGQTTKAIELLGHAVTVEAATLGGERASLLSSRHELARAHHSDGRVKEAIELLEPVIEAYEATLDEGHPDRLSSQHELARAYYSDDRLGESIELLEQVVKIRQKTLDEGHDDRVGSEYELARSYHSHGRVKEAIELLEYIVKVEAEKLDERHPDLLVARHELAMAYWSAGRVREAAEILECLVKVRETSLDEANAHRIPPQEELEASLAQLHLEATCWMDKEEKP
ncbi:phosphorylase superfamily protein [Colletotrichum falcatum]|nr:phosphorylase superfamily protein [Colletotrichum falcatum]